MEFSFGSQRSDSISSNDRLKKAIERNRAKQAKRYKKTTKRNDKHAYAPNHLAQDFTASQPGETWCGDITYIWTAVGWLYLAIVIDLYSRRIVGWSMNERITCELVIDALMMALWRRKPEAGLMHHSDRGSQCASADFQALLKAHEIECSMSGVGNCYDNAAVESWFGPRPPAAQTTPKDG